MTSEDRANHGLCLDGLDSAKERFLKAYPEFLDTHTLDELRDTDYARLDRLGHTYLDYTGGGLYAESQVLAHQELLLNNVFGNPHSSNPTSLAMTHLVESARAAVLNYFNASAEEYICIFTANASGALKLVGESYPFAPGGQYALTYDNHNSVNGIREYARARGAKVTYIPILPPNMRADEQKRMAVLDQGQEGQNQLFAYPAQSNFSGVQHPLEWIDEAHARGWDVLLDAAAFVPSNRLDLSQAHPDFVSLSFYKLFGYPTGVGALLMRRKMLTKLHRPWFAGGTITVASVQGNAHFLHEGAEAFEDGTLNYLTLPAVEISLKHIASIGYEAIHKRVACLTGWLLKELAALHHDSGEALIHIYGPLEMDMRGGTIALNFFDSCGHYIDHRVVEARANEVRISLRTGCFCNPGGGEVALGLTASDINTCFTGHNRMTFDDFRMCLNDRSTGAVRVSVGLVSTFEDAYKLLCFARGLLNHKCDEV